MDPYAVDWDTEAAAEAAEGFSWYAERDPDVADRFDQAIAKAERAVADAPFQWQSHLHGTRRYVLRGWPYMLIYQVFDRRVLIVACQHCKRRPGYWADRLE
jgi:toxin ParE1/3/4